MTFKLPPLSERANRVTPFMVMEVMEKARQLESEGRSVIHMEVGEPDFPTPSVVVETMVKAIQDGAYYYAHSQGTPLLREALSRHYKKHYGVSIPPHRFLVTPGTSVGLSLLFGALLEPGDSVILSNPYYACYPNFVEFYGGKPLLSLVKEVDGFKLDPSALKELIAANSKVKAILINSPANPTGAVLEPKRLKAIAELGPLVISDEIYHGLSYQEERDHTILEYTDRAVVVGGFSKAYSMTGWRIGYLIVPEPYVRPLQSICQNFVISVNSAVQMAAETALEHAWPEVERMRFLYDKRRKLMINGLRSLGLGILVEPFGAFYVLANVSHVNGDSRALAMEILDKAGLATTPGCEFGSGAEGFLRFSYATSPENIDEGLLRLKNFLAEKGKLP
ncbi:MAG: pyridoxal phosphate-dependent aminotransferase [Deltaproteobacteria bacterium]|jgi:aspartate/methionine/tyrosine aminotransferase|nr:pyridoxal phosphate-dependent aminotransferase [Deltaproteobacteria bacterium]